MGLTLTLNPGGRIMIGPEDNDIRVKLAGVENPGTPHEQVLLYVEEPKRKPYTRPVRLQQEVAIGPATVQFAGSESNGLGEGRSYRLYFKAPDTVPINHEGIFHKRAEKAEEERPRTVEVALTEKETGRSRTIESLSVGAGPAKVKVELLRVNNAESSEREAVLQVRTPDGETTERTVRQGQAIEAGQAQIAFVGPAPTSGHFSFDVTALGKVPLRPVIYSRPYQPRAEVPAPADKPLPGKVFYLKTSARRSADSRARVLVGGDGDDNTRVELVRVENPHTRDAKATLKVSTPGGEQEVALGLLETAEGGPAKITFLGKHPDESDDRYAIRFATPREISTNMEDSMHRRALAMSSRPGTEAQGR